MSCQKKHTSECPAAQGRKTNPSLICLEVGEEYCFKARPPRMTEAQFTSKQNELLAELPVQFRSAFSYYAYEHGHSSGYEEIICVLKDIISDFLPSIQEFEKSLKNP